MSNSMAATQRFIITGLCLLLVLRHCSGGEAPLPAVPKTGMTSAASNTRSSSQLEMARRLYRQLCASCHGNDFTGGRFRDAVPDIPDFTNSRWHSQRTDAKLVNSILEGKGTEMPSFGQRLNETEVRALVSLIRQANAAPPKNVKEAPVDSAFVNRFAALCEELEELKKQFHELDQKPPKP